MKKVLHILNSSSFSGAESVSISIINMLKDNKNYTGIYASLSGSIENVIAENDIQFIQIKKMNFFEIRKMIKKINPDIIHTHDFTASIITSLIVRNIPIISHIHNNAPWLKKINHRTVAFYISILLTKKTLIVSPSIQNEYVFKKVIPNKLINIGNPIDAKKIIKLSEERCSQFFDIIFIGRLEKAKNPIKFLEIVSKLKKSMPDIKVGIIGNGSLKNECEKIAYDLGLINNLNFLGFEHNPYKYLSKSKILCMTSTYEGYGLVAAEALVLGKPVVAPSIGGLPTIVNEHCGKLTNDDSEYINEIIELLTNKNYYSSKSKSAIENSFTNKKFEEYMRKITEEYKLYS